MLRIRFIIIKTIVLLVALSSVACEPDTTSIYHKVQQFNLAANQRLWTSKGIHSYRYTVRRTCYCVGGIANRPFRVQVIDDVVASVDPLLMENETIASLSRQQREDLASLDTISEIFKLASKSLETIRSGTVEINYDPSYNYPADIKIDPIPNAIDDEIWYSVADFQIITAH